MLDKGEEDNTLVRHQLIQELRVHKESYTRLYEKKENFNTIYESLVHCISRPKSKDKWIHFPEMGHLIANVYDRVCIDLTRYNFSEIFFSLRTVPPQNPNDRIMCIRRPLKMRHFVQVYLNLVCSILLTSPKWTTRSTTKAKT